MDVLLLSDSPGKAIIWLNNVPLLGMLHSFGLDHSDPAMCLFNLSQALMAALEHGKSQLK